MARIPIEDAAPLRADDVALSSYDERYAQGVVKFFKEEKGHGGITSPEVAGDVWVHFSHIDMPGYRTLEPGQRVEFRYERRDQDSWRYVATWVRPL